MALFVPFRALGLVTDGDTPFVTQRRGSETFIITSVGRSWQVRLLAMIVEALLSCTSIVLLHHVDFTECDLYFVCRFITHPHCV